MASCGLEAVNEPFEGAASQLSLDSFEGGGGGGNSHWRPGIHVPPPPRVIGKIKKTLPWL